MKISLNWLKKYVPIPESVTNEDLIRLIGARLVEVEGVINESHKYDNIYVVRVESCEKIPETHLSLCMINNGANELVQVVCGAPNVRTGMLAVWIAPGAIVPASVHEDAPFVIGKRKMQGYESSGMLAGADELDFGDDHSGIVEIDPSMAKPGDLLKDIFELDDLILEIENKSLTHRPDCFGIIGFAREVAGVLGQQFEYDFSRDGSLAPVVTGLTPSSSVVTSGSPRKAYSQLLPSIRIPDSNICQRYSVVLLGKHGEIEKKYLTWVDTILSKSGMKPISPIVDATNYLMLLTGQPLHAFDYDKFVAVGGDEKPEITVRLARDGEKLVLLDGTEALLNGNDIVICSGDIPVALAGAMGGANTMIDENTKNILLESATFSLYNLRKTQMAHGIFSEAITRFTKGQPAYQTLDVALNCAGMLKDGFEVVGVSDEYSKPAKDIVVKITTKEINDLLGTDYDDALIVDTLSNVGFAVRKHFGSFEVTVPAWRIDIHIKEDVIEEVGRLLGYDNITPTLPLHRTADKNDMLELKSEIRELMSKYGANEVLTYSFVSQRLIERAGQDPKNSYKIVNSISPELQYVRQSLVPSLLEKAYLNEKLPVDQFVIFEMNPIYRKEWGMTSENVPVEKMKIGAVVAERKGTGTPFYLAKKYAAKILEEMQIPVQFIPIKSKDAETLPFEPKRTAEIRLENGEYLGVVGEFRNSIRNDFKLAPFAAGFEMDLDLILQNKAKNKKIDLTERSYEDLTVETNESYAEVEAKVKKEHPSAIILPLSIYQPDNSDIKHITVRIVE